MKTAEQIFQQADDPELSIEALHEIAGTFSETKQPRRIGHVEYCTYTFKDGSTLTIGDNGYINCEIQPESEE